MSRIYFIGDSRVYSATKDQALQLCQAVIDGKEDLNELLVTFRVLKDDAPNVGEGRFGKMFYAYWICNLDRYSAKETIKEINQGEKNV